MDCDELLAQLVTEEGLADTASPPSAPIETVASRDASFKPHKRARLAVLAAGGQAKLTFKGHIVNAERVDAMTDGLQRLRRCMPGMRCVLVLQ